MMIIGPICKTTMIEPLKIKNKSNYFWDDMIYLDDFNVELVKLESQIGADIYYIVYVVNKPEFNINSINLLYLVVRYLLGRAEKINGSNDRYLVVDEGANSNKRVLDVFDKLWKFIGDGVNKIMKNNDKITFGDADDAVKGYNKLRFNSNIDLLG